MYDILLAISSNTFTSLRIPLFHKIKIHMKTRTTGLLVVFPAIIAVLRSRDSFSTKAGEESAGHEKTLFNVSAIRKLSPGQIQTAIQLSLKKSDWIIADQSEGTITAELTRSRTSGKLRIAYDSESISIENQSTDNTGKPHSPVSAIKNLMNEIQKNLLAGFSE
jgi:hypothetical protein